MIPTPACLRCPPAPGSILYGASWKCSACGRTGVVTIEQRVPADVLARDAEVVREILDRTTREESISLGASECDSLERWCVNYAAQRGVSINLHPAPKPWADAGGEAPR